MAATAAQWRQGEENLGLGRSTLVVGLGKSGQSVLRFLSRHGAPLQAADTRQDPPALSRLQQQYPGLEISLGPLRATLLESVERIVLSPGISRWDPAIQQAVAAGVEVVGDVELFARVATAPVVAITGSNGKSTVTTLVAEMATKGGMEVRAGGNLGTPVLDLLGEGEPDLYVVELSSFQLETTKSLAPEAAVVLNVSPDHMDRYATLDHYAEVKGLVYSRAAHRIYDHGDGWSSRLAMGDGDVGSLHPYGLGRPVNRSAYGVCRGDSVVGGGWICRGDELLTPLEGVRIRGRHNHSNALAALALGEAVGIPVAAMVETLQEFGGLPHRTEWVAEWHGVQWVNDSKGTNVGATEAAILGLQPEAGGDGEKIVLVAGGEGKGADFSPLRPLAGELLRAVVLMGEDAHLIADSLGGTVPITLVDHMEGAVRAAAELAESGDTVLLSPACASFDMFSGFEARGDAFRRAVEDLVEGRL